MKKLNFKFAVLIPVLFALSCSLATDPVEERSNEALKAEGDIVIGAAANWKYHQKLWQGIELALGEINRAGGVLGRKIRIIKGDDEGSLTTGQAVAHRFAENKAMVAMLGHYNSYISVPTSIIYEYYGLLMMSYSTSPRLTRQGFTRVFRSSPDDEIFGKELAEFSRRQGYRAVMIYHSRNEYGTGLANAFEKRCQALGIRVMDRLAYDSFGHARTFEKDLTYWKDNFKFDALFVAGVTPQAAEVVKAARDMGIDVPILGGDGLDSPDLIRIAGAGAEGTIVSSVFHPADPRPEAQIFVTAFREKFGALPNHMSVMGYDGLKVIVYAIERAGSPDPERLAEALRSVRDYQGASGLFRYDEKGDLVGRSISMSVVRDGRFVYLPDGTGAMARLQKERGKG